MTKEKIKTKNENQKTFSDLTNKSWFMDKNNVKIGDNFQQINSGNFQTLEVKEILFGEHHNTWKLVITTDDKIYLLKSSRELK